ncbi:MAG: Holliday junction branch migration protein RuvA [Opitutales bacterium]|nr:Holliday junction branch migration protein RuvA [Opitutales bacterium]MCH8539564.1 Holliday junction branch migration protein RuvA [Opitutales bacterium]
MIATIRGKLTQATPVQAIIECGGLGYEVFIPITTAEKLPSLGEEAMLHTVAVYREDNQSLYGFSTRDEKDFFRLLVEKVSGVGPKVALSIMSKLSLPVLRSAIGNGDAALLAKCPGIGKKTAERLIVELRDKVGMDFLPSGESPASATGGTGTAPESTGGSGVSPFQDAVMALISLGYKAPEADKAIRKAQSAIGHDATVEALIKKALG